MPQELSPAEVWLLSIIHELGEGDAFQILERTSEEKDWKYSTIKTITTRLCQKGYVEARKVSRRWVYRPIVPQTTSFTWVMKRLFGSTLERNLSPLVSYLVNIKKLNKQEEELLKSLLENKPESDAE